jgi:hypothetical protein
MSRKLNLLELASAALPAKPSHSKWLYLAPVVIQLRRNGFQLRPAIRWLAEQGEITKADVPSVYRSLRQHFLRATTTKKKKRVTK